jgi:hypothetical protein
MKAWLARSRHGGRTEHPLESLRGRARRWAELSAAYSNGDHLGVSGQDASRMLEDLQDRESVRE